jgi:FxsC-like protein
MPYKVFISYSSDNSDEFLKRFVRDLARTLGKNTKEMQMVFFDQEGIGGGEQWAPKIIEALQTSDVLMPLLSDEYYKSDYCQKELIFFRRRCEALFGEGARLPAVIIPIIWTPFKQAPPAIAEFQYTHGDKEAPHNTRGVRAEVQTGPGRPRHKEFLVSLANAIHAARPPEIPRLANPPGLADITVARPIPATSVRVGPKHVRFVYVAAHPDVIGTARDTQPYVEVGGPDWRPYFPTERQELHQMLQNFVSRAELNLSSDELKFTENLAADIASCLAQRQIVVLIVDGWSLHSIERYRKVLQPLDGLLDYHWGVLVPNENDPKIIENMGPQIAEALRVTFGRHARMLPTFYRANLGSPEEFTKALRELLINIREEIRKQAVVEVPVPAGPRKSTVHGPS